ncbi:uncharacterized protein BO88DRAFT_394142 [Aspergillus vadensis CBS 113365]|uniref:Prion-inhibition and propagation HeLo domain-containing protein n=1 Tax=Aspergillus vadensis (strain CBS 113365 / IMI 142717 / IBT 24658) TaxID=1448311 RepID=A0A319BRL7_ASPVC|nr:hypothetical protein BO88DRAFT_394142 [Aspergillus vadensis CBS 113365]PYH65828.1 hypothetical protein BO88DRAFT_394142 [Aspergillus vadensis CBS 113365]
MDVYGTAVTAVQQVIQVTIFIKGVISDVKAYDDDRAAIQLRLDLQLTSLEFFQRRFLDKKRGLLLPGQLPDWVGETICNLLLKMGRVLVEYRVLVKEYEILDASTAALDHGDDALPKGEKWRQCFLDRTKAKAKAIKLKGYDWALFDKKKLLGVLAEYKEWTDSLRDLMQHFSQEALYTLTDGSAAKSPPAATEVQGTGLEEVVKRQQLAFLHAPADFRELEGTITESGSASDGFHLGSWTHQDQSTPVVLEFRPYDRRLRYDDIDEEEIAELKAPLRDLAWLLQNATFSEGKGTAEMSQPTIYSLQCLGYKDDAEKERTVFAYRLPLHGTDDKSIAVQNSLTTLHSLINQVDPQTKRPTKPSLEDRFAIAHCLALTTLNVHGSLWLHKNIWNNGIELMSKLSLATTATSNKGGLRRPRLLAFLSDWGYARPVEGATDMRSDFEIEPNLYRHPNRQGAPTHHFSRLHDIYALGVVLLEIGLWKTVSRLFETRIKEAQRTRKLPKARDVCAALTSLAQRDLPKEMGSSYASAVVACLTGDFRRGSDLELSLDFRAKVLDCVAEGLRL